MGSESFDLSAEVIPLLLSTMQLPEMERAEAQALKDHDSQVAAQGLVQLYENLGVGILHHNCITWC